MMWKYLSFNLAKLIRKPILVFNTLVLLVTARQGGSEPKTAFKWRLDRIICPKLRITCLTIPDLMVLITEVAELQSHFSTCH